MPNSKLSQQVNAAIAAHRQISRYRRYAAPQLAPGPDPYGHLHQMSPDHQAEYADNFQRLLKPAAVKNTLEFLVKYKE